MKDKCRMRYKAPLMSEYSEAFKRKVVMEVENGIISKDGAKYKYGISGNSMVLDWCRKYGRLRHPQTQTWTMKPPTEDERTRMENRIRELEAALGEAKVKVEVYEAMLEIAKVRTGIDIKKSLVRGRPAHSRRRATTRCSETVCDPWTDQAELL